MNAQPCLDLDFVRSQFPAFAEPSLQGQACFENAGGSYWVVPHDWFMWGGIPTPRRVDRVDCPNTKNYRSRTIACSAS